MNIQVSFINNASLIKMLGGKTEIKNTYLILENLESTRKWEVAYTKEILEK